MTRIGRTSRRIIVSSGVLLVVVVLLGLVPWRLEAAEPKEGEKQPTTKMCEESDPLPATPPVHLECKLYTIDILENGTRLAAVNKLSGERKVIDVPKDTTVTDLIVGDTVAVCEMRGTPISQLILYNGNFHKWSTFPLPTQDRPLKVVCPCVGDFMVAYQMKGQVVAYSGTTDKWDTLSTNETPAVGDDFVMVNSATNNSVFTATSGVWVTVKTSIGGYSEEGKTSAEIEKRWSWAVTAGDYKSFGPTATMEERIRLAQAYSVIAENTLARNEAVNRQVPYTIPKVSIQLLELQRDLTRVDVQYWEAVQHGRDKDARETALRHAILKTEIAQAEINKAEEINRHLPQTISTTELRRLQSERELAGLHLAKVKAAIAQDSVGKRVTSLPNATGSVLTGEVTIP